MLGRTVEERTDVRSEMIASFLCATTALTPSLLLRYPTRVAPRNIRAELGVNQQQANVQSAASEILASCEWDGRWDERAAWALEDSVPKYSLGRAVLWRRMSLEVPELLCFSPTELRARYLALVGPQRAAQLQEEPPILEDWVCVAPGRYEGVVHNLPSLSDGALRATVEHAEPAAHSDDGDALAGACSAEGLDGQRRWVRTAAGTVFELGAPRVADGSEGALFGAETVDGPIERAASFARALVGSEESEVGAAAGHVARGAGGAAAVARPALVTAGALLATAAAAFALFGHHINVSVFIV